MNAYTFPEVPAHVPLGTLVPNMHVIVMSRRYAREWAAKTRGSMGYRVLVQTYGGTSHSAYWTVREFRAKLRSFGLSVATYRVGRGLRYGRTVWGAK